jgi:murein tripeptide amidase MpaA
MKFLMNFMSFDTRSGCQAAAEVIMHALRCNLLRENPTTRNEAEDAHTKAVLGVEQKDAERQESAPAEIPEKCPVSRPKDIDTPERGQLKLNSTSLRDVGKKTTEEHDMWQKKADHLLMILICKCGLAKKITGEYISQQAALVRQRTKYALRQSQDLTFTMDGTSSRRSDQFHTDHACTPSRDKESHNAEWIKSGVLEINR